MEAALQAAEEEHASDPERAELLARARRFKTSWVELAEALSSARSGRFLRWGYASFEDYTRLELHLRPETVEKLTGSYGFLKRNAPEVLERDGVRERVPPYQSVDFLRRAEEANHAPEDVVDAMRRRVFEDAAPAAQLTKEFKEVAFPIDDATRKARDIAGVRNVAKRLLELLDETDVVSDELSSRAKRAVSALMDSLAKEP